MTAEPSSAAAAKCRESCFRHAVPSTVQAEAHVPEWEAERRVAKKRALQTEGVFSFPPAHVRQELLEAYFKWFHPNFAILDEDEFWSSYNMFDFSGVLLQAMLFIGVIHCDESTLTKLG